MSDKIIATEGRPTPSARPVRPLRLILPGGEGHLGRILARHLSGKGRTVSTLTCKAPMSSGLKASTVSVAVNSDLAYPQWQALQWDGETLGAWTEALEDADMLIHLSGRSVDCRYTAANRAAILRSRVDSTTALGRAIQSLKHPPRVWLNASTATIYRHAYDSPMDEFPGEIGGDEPDAPPSWRFSVDVARQWEQAFFGAPTPETRKIALRTAVVMSPESRGIFAIILRLARVGLGGAWGNGRQYMTSIHDVDFVRATEFLIEREEISGAISLASPNPLRNGQFLANLRGTWGIRLGLPSPGWMLALGVIVLRTEIALFLKSRRVVPAISSRSQLSVLLSMVRSGARPCMPLAH